MSLCFVTPTSYTILVYITPDVGATKHGIITKRDFSHIWSYVHYYSVSKFSAKIQLGAVLRPFHYPLK